MKDWSLPTPIMDANNDYNWDIGIAVSFGHLIPKRIIKSFRYGMLNMHPSLLPQFSLVYFYVFRFI